MMCKTRRPTVLDILRLVLITMHLLIFIIGSMLIYYGANELFTDKILKSYFILFFGNPRNISITVGIFILLVSIIGLSVTSFVKDVSLSKMHILFLVLLALYQVAYCIDIFVLNQLPDFMKKNMNYGINYYQFNQSDRFSVAWDTIQEDRQCCGVYGYLDWFECDECLVLNYFPRSCCTNESNQCHLKNPNSTVEDPVPQVFLVGCFSQVVKMIDHHFFYSLQWFSLFILLQILIIMFSFMHIAQIDRRMKLDQQILTPHELQDSDSDDFFAIKESTKMIRRNRVKTKLSH